MIAAPNHASRLEKIHKSPTTGVKGATKETSTPPNDETAGNHRLTQESPSEGRVEISHRQEKGESDPLEQAPRMAVSPPHALENCQQPIPTTEAGERIAHKEAKEITTLYETSILHTPPASATKESRCQLPGFNTEKRDDYPPKMELGQNTQIHEPDGRFLAKGQ